MHVHRQNPKFIINRFRICVAIWLILTMLNLHVNLIDVGTVQQSTQVSHELRHSGITVIQGL